MGQVTVTRLAGLVVLLAACETPPLTIKFRLTDGDSQQCAGDTGNRAKSCSDISIDCRAVLSVRIVPPATPEVPFVSVCEALQPSQRKLCSIAAIDLPQPKDPIPEQTLEVQMAVFAYDALERDADGKLICPRVDFGVDNLPIESVDCADLDPGACARRPAIGGRAFYHPGDSETLIELGCTELPLLHRETCAGINRTAVTATVNEFEFPASVDLATANRLFVSIGEPTNTNGNYTLDSSKTHPLQRTLAASLPTWDGDFVDLGLTTTSCIEVLEDVPQATRTVTCSTLKDPANIDSTGIRLKAETLTTILKALYGPSPTFPTKGLVVGIVLDKNFTPQAGVQVRPMCGTTQCWIRYLSADKQSFTPRMTSGVTSSNGIWVSEDAPYMSSFTTNALVTEVFGGLVENKVTIVVLQESSIGGGL